MVARGVPIYLVPGNHERSTIPHRHLAEHPLIHLFDRPRCFILQKDCLTLALSGFPFVRRGIRERFLDQLELHPGGMNPSQLKSWIATRIENMPADSIVKVKVTGTASRGAMDGLRAASLRALAPPTMNIEARFTDHSYYR